MPIDTPFAFSLSFIPRSQISKKKKPNKTMHEEVSTFFIVIQ